MLAFSTNFYPPSAELGNQAVDLMATAAMDLIGATDAMVGVATEMMLMADGMSNGTMEMDGVFVETALGLVQNTMDATAALGEISNKTDCDQLTNTNFS